jgi:Ca-activated chloride channel family protein
MNFSSPLLLVVGLLIAVALAATAVVFARRRAAALAAGGITSTRRWAHLGVGFTIAGLAVLAMGAAGPTATVPVPRSAGTVILAVDVSNSMSADDISPTRLAAAQKAARSFIKAQPDSIDIGVVAFERGALTTARPNADHALALGAIDRLKVTGGTSLGTAIVGSLSAITGKTVTLERDGPDPDIGYWPSATIVLFSDGQDLGDGADTERAAALAEKAGVHIDTVGVGTKAGTAVKVDGFSLDTALNEETLTSIAQTTGGAYHPASDTSELEGVASTIDLRLTVSDEDLPLAGGFIALALALLAAGSVLTIFRSGRVI